MSLTLNLKIIQVLCGEVYEKRKMQFFLGCDGELGQGKVSAFWGQPWLHEDLNPFIPSDNPAFQKQKVQALFRIDPYEQDVDIIRDLFNSRDQQNILKTSLINGSTANEVFWSKDLSDNYLVPCAYKPI